MKYFATVLLVGDGPGLDRAQRSLEHPELFEVARTTSVDDALWRLQRLIFDVAIVGGPGTRLLETVIRLREQAPKTPIIVMLGDGLNPDLVDRLLAFGADRCFPPSASGSDLREAVLASGS